MRDRSCVIIYVIYVIILIWGAFGLPSRRSKSYRSRFEMWSFTWMLCLDSKNTGKATQLVKSACLWKRNRWKFPSENIGVQGGIFSLIDSSIGCFFHVFSIGFSRFLNRFICWCAFERGHNTVVLLGLATFAGLCVLRSEVRTRRFLLRSARLASRDQRLWKCSRQNHALVSCFRNCFSPQAIGLVSSTIVKVGRIAFRLSLWFSGADPSWAAKRFRGRFDQGTAKFGGVSGTDPSWAAKRFIFGCQEVLWKVPPRFHEDRASFVISLIFLVFWNRSLSFPKGFCGGFPITSLHLSLNSFNSFFSFSPTVLALGSSATGGAFMFVWLCGPSSSLRAKSLYGRAASSERGNAGHHRIQ